MTMKPVGGQSQVMCPRNEGLAFSYDCRSLSPSDFVRTFASSISCMPLVYAANLTKGKIVSRSMKRPRAKEYTYSGEIFPIEGAISALIKVWRHPLYASFRARAITAFPPLNNGGEMSTSFVSRALFTGTHILWPIRLTPFVRLCSDMNLPRSLAMWE